MQGTLIVMEGIDGSGKSTQYSLLRDRLAAEDIDFRCAAFPRYSKPSSSLIRAYLGGEYGKKPGDVNPYAASTFYAVDRFDSFRTEWGDYYQEGGLVLCDRWTTSNACHQGSKFTDPEERRAFLDWLRDFEYGLLGLPEPDLVLYLDTDMDVARRQLARRQSDTHETADIHETDFEYLEACLKAGRQAAEHYGWKRVCSVENGLLRSPEEIHEDIFRAVRDIIQ